MKYEFDKQVQFNPDALDRMYQECFGYKTDGVFVEVGAYDGHTYSHTCGLAAIGWRGVYVEPVPELAEKCRQTHKDRPGISVIEAAVTSWGGGLCALFIDEYSCCGSTINGSVCKNPKVINVYTRTLDSLLEEQKILPDFDLLSIDVEFGELEVLRGFTLHQWLPKMIIIELCEQHPEPKRTLAKPARDYCYEIFPKCGYRPIYVDQINTIFVR